jgi:putative DNA primase/helicase
MSALAAALDYVKRRGWAVFPAPPGTKKSYKSGRYGNNNPWGMTSIVEAVEDDFKKWPEAGVGVPTGLVNRMFVVEVDTLEGHGVDGLAGLRALEAEHGVLPETLMAESPTGSIHRYFAWPKVLSVDIRNSDGKLAPGVDVRGNGGMVVAPPTRTRKASTAGLTTCRSPPRRAGWSSWSKEVVVCRALMARRVTSSANRSRTMSCAI